MTAASIWGAIGRTLVEYASLNEICDQRPVVSG